MKFAKYLITLAFAFCAFTSMTKAQGTPTVQLLASGSSALFQELGVGSQHVTGISCLWTYAKTSTAGGTPYFAATDERIPKDENGPIWIAWGPGNGTGGTCATPAGAYDVYVYISLDSVLGNRCFFEVDSSNISGCVLTFQNASGITGGGANGNQLSGLTDTAVALPASLITALSAGIHFNAAGTDIRPEDAKFATTRMFSACNTLIPRQYFNQDSFFLYGLGYGTGNIGTAVSGSATTGSGSFHVYNYNITGNDPITGNAVPTGWALNTVGVQPIIIAVAPITDGQVAGMSNITSFTLAELLQGNLGRTNDLLLSSAATGGTEVFSTIIREPLSGTYNTMEFSLPNGTQYHGSQEYGNCSSGGTPTQNPLQPLPSGAGVFGPNVGRYRAIGTGKVTLCLQSWNTTGTACGSVNNYTNTGGPALGYFFWSAGNVNAGSSNSSGSTPPLTNVKYLTVDGVDPLLNQNATGYTYNGILPGTICGLTGNNCSGDPGLSAVTFSGVNAGNYKIWSPLRLISGSSASTGASNLLSGLAAVDPSQNDYIPVSKLNIWHVHFFINNQSIPNPSDGNNSVGGVNICSGGTPEQGGDAGGSTMLVQNNANFCHDFGASTGGFLNKTQ